MSNRKGVDTSGMRAAMAAMVVEMKPHLERKDVLGAQSRLMTACLGPYFDALANEMDAETEPDHTFTAVVVMLTHMVASAAISFQIPELSPAQRVERICEEVSRRAEIRVLDRSSFVKAPIVEGGRG